MIKQAILYTINVNTQWDWDALENGVSEPNQLYQDPEGQQKERGGWVAFEQWGEDTHLIDTVENVRRLRYRLGNRNVPPAVLKHELKKRLNDLESEGVDVKSLSKGEIKEMKETLFDTLLQNAFIKTKEVDVFISPDNGWVAIGTTNVKLADRVTDALRMAYGQWPVALYELPEKFNLKAIFTGELKLIDQLERGYLVKCKDAEGGVVTANQRMLDNALSDHAADMAVQQLEFKLEDDIAFTLSVEGYISRLKLSVKDIEEDDDVEEDEIAMLQAETLIIENTLNRIKLVVDDQANQD